MSSALGTHRCRVCAADVPDATPRCPKCSAPQGKLAACPHCRGEGGISPHNELRYACDLCGGPRVPSFGTEGASSGRELPALHRAEKARRGRAGWRAATIASALLLSFALLTVVGLGLAGVGGLRLGVTGALFIMPSVLVFAMAMVRVRARGREIEPAIDAAWTAAATDIAEQSRGVVSANDLARRLGIEEPQAEELLALLDVNAALQRRAPDRVRIDPSVLPSQALDELGRDEPSAHEKKL